MDIQVGDILSLKKAHPCGSKDWQVLRIGADFKLRCCGCGHEVMGPRAQFEKSVRQVGRGGKYTRSRLPVELVWYEDCGSPQAARSREWHVKRLTRAEKLRLIDTNP